jgi:hypothetical protein
MVPLKFGHAVQDAHDDIPNTFRVFIQLPCKAAGHGTELTLAGERDRMERDIVRRKSTDESICNALQNSTQFLKLFWRENKGEVRDLGNLDLRLGKRTYYLPKAFTETISDRSSNPWFYVPERFVDSDDNFRGRMHLEDLAHYFLHLVSFFVFE